jgi:rRNA small subunit pseudouridine methyltransferase Nep1
MLTLVLAEAEVERIPKEILTHPAIIASARQRGKEPARLLLDSNYHHAAMSPLAEGRRRGRPDIAHLFLLTALESVVNKQGQLTIIVHTRNNDMIQVDPKTRIMRNYERFLGLLEQLFEQQVVPEKSHPLLTLQQDVSLLQVIEKAKADAVIVFSKQGKSIPLPQYFAEMKKQNTRHLLCVVGGFPSGSFVSDLTTITTECISLYPDMLPAWTVASEILVNYENVFR